MNHMSLYLAFVKIRLRGIVEYPGAFWSETIAKTMGWAADLIIIYLMIFRFESVLNWSAYEVLLLYSINAVSYALAGFFMFSAFGRLSEHIQWGSFDDALVKPVNPFLYMCFKGFTTGYIGNLISTLTALIVCVVKLNIVGNLFNILYLILIIIGATLIHGALFMFINIPVFWIIKADGLKAFRGALEDFIRYPISIYDRWIQLMLTFVFPIAFINFYPAQFVLNKSDFLGFNPAFAHLTPIIGVVLYFLGYRFFFLGIRHYKSTGT